MTKFNLALYLLGLGISFTVYFVDSLEIERICGGSTSCQGEFPYVVSIQKSGQSICSGSILSSNKILTAAHCVCDSKGVYTGFPYKVFAGETNLKAKKNAIITTVTKIYVHKNFLPERSLDDIAILELEKQLNLKNYPAVRIPPLDFDYRTLNRTQAVIAGFGWDWVETIENPITLEKRDYGGRKEKTMKYATVEIIPNNECKEKNEQEVITNTRVCAQVIQQDKDAAQGVCSGDSGAPLVLPETSTLIGILSTSPIGCNETLRPAVYTRTAPYFTFINDIIDGKPNNDAVVYNASTSNFDALKKLGKKTLKSITWGLKDMTKIIIDEVTEISYQYEKEFGKPEQEYYGYKVN